MKITDLTAVVIMGRLNCTRAFWRSGRVASLPWSTRVSRMSARTTSHQCRDSRCGNVLLANVSVLSGCSHISIDTTTRSDCRRKNEAYALADLFDCKTYPHSTSHMYIYLAFHASGGALTCQPSRMVASPRPSTGGALHYLPTIQFPEA